MKRYDLCCSYDGGGHAEEEASEVGDYVRYEDAVAAVLAEREACAKVCEEFAWPFNAYRLGEVADRIRKRANA